MKTDLDKFRDDNNGSLPAFTLPGGYPLYYLDKEDNVLCADCANRASQEAVACDTNWEDPGLFCDECGMRILSAYAEETE